MKKIRTILAYYNGEKFINEQMQSIVDQIIPEGYEHEIYIYDDGSSIESSNYLDEKWKKFSKIIHKKNEGITLTFFKALAAAQNEGVDIVFLSDQDDIFLEGKYAEHLKKHEAGFGFVSSYSRKWFYEDNAFQDIQINDWAGHRLSLEIKNAEIEFSKLIPEIFKFNRTLHSHRYHDGLLSIIYGVKSSISFIEAPFTNYRSNNQSIMHEVNKSEEVKKMYKDYYGFYFDVMKPFFLASFNEHLKIKQYNKALYFFDGNYLKCNQLAKIRMHWNNFAMHIRFRRMRNI